MYTKDELKGILMCLGKPFTAIYGGEGKTIIRTQIIVRGKLNFLQALVTTLTQYKVEANIQKTNQGYSVLAITKRQSLYNLLDLWETIPDIFPKGNQHHWKLLKDFLDEVRKDIHKSDDGIQELKWMIRNAKEE